MSYLTLESANAWTDRRRLNLEELSEELESQIASQIIGRASQVFDTSLWLDDETTPKLILSIIAMQYVGRWYQSKTLDNISEIDNYGSKLIRDSYQVLDAVVLGEIALRDQDGELVLPSGSGAISGEPFEGEPQFSMELEF